MILSHLEQRSLLNRETMVFSNGSQCGPQVSNVSIPLKFARDANSQIPSNQKIQEWTYLSVF